jgi:hypothetical protein
MLKKLLLIALYVLVVVPARLVTLVVGDPLRRRWDAGAETYWMPVRPGGEAA